MKKFIFIFLIISKISLANILADEDLSIDPNSISENSEQLKLHNQNQDNYKKIAVLQGLNKITAKISSIEIPVNHSSYFGNLKITIYSCWKAPIDQSPENKILVKINEKSLTEDSEKEIFYGWLFSSSSAVSSLAHSVYDIVAVDCK